MSKQVVHGALLQCSLGLAPSSLVVLPTRMTDDGGVPAANIMDHIPMLNIMPFGMCSSIEDPCIPNTPAPWVPGSPTVLIDNKPSLNDTSKCMCVWAGVISVTFPGQVTTDIP